MLPDRRLSLNATYDSVDVRPLYTSKIKPIRAFCLLAMVAALVLTSACSSMSESVRKARGAKTATISRSSLSAIPCVKEAAQSAYGVTGDIEYERMRYGTANTTPGLGPTSQFVLYLDQKEEAAESDKKPAGPRVSFEFWERSPVSTGVRYWVDAPEPQRAELEAKALEAIERCGGSSEMKRGL